MKLLAQLPTPTIATRTLPSSGSMSVAAAPLRGVAVLLTHMKAILSGAGEVANYPLLGVGYSSGSATSSALSSLRTCQTRWPTVNAVSPAIV